MTSKHSNYRNQAITVFELIKGFTSEPTDNSMKTAIEMAGYVLELTDYIAKLELELTIEKHKIKAQKKITEEAMELLKTINT